MKLSFVWIWKVDHFIIEYICDLITSTLIIWSWWFKWINRWHYVNIHRIHTTKKRNSKTHSRKRSLFSSRFDSYTYFGFCKFISFFFNEYFVFFEIRVDQVGDMKIYRNSNNDIQVKSRKYGLTCLSFLWHAQEILSSVFKLDFDEKRRDRNSFVWECPILFER